MKKIKLRKIQLVLLVILASCMTLKAQTIKVQPYLQDASPNSIYILWETDSMDESIAEWGLTNELGNLTSGTANASNGDARIHEVKLEGLSVKQAERFLEEAFEEIIQDPFVNLTVLSWRVFVFKGLGGAGQVVPIEFQNTTLVEILAIAGGIPQDAKAYKIKVIRGVDKGKPQVFMVDYSTISHVKNTNLQILSNDIIYIEPVQRISNGLVAELSPYLSLLSVILLISNLLGNNAG